jgi:large subunit ribosomal protein L5
MEKQEMKTEMKEKKKTTKVVKEKTEENKVVKEKTIKDKTSENPMRKIKLDKLVLNIGGTGDDLEKGVKLLTYITKRKPAKMKSFKRIPTLGVRPKLEVGAVVTLRKDLEKDLKKFLSAVDNQLKTKQVSENNFSFGIKEYIEIPGIEFQREIGMIGLDVTVVFKRTGRRVRLRKIKTGRVSKRQSISREEIIKFMEENFGTKFVEKKE